MSRLYRVQFRADNGADWDVLWFATLAEAQRAARRAPERDPVVDVVHKPPGKAALVDLLNNATAHRDALAQLF